MYGGGRDPNGRGLDEEIQIADDMWKERVSMAEGGQLVQPGPGRQGYKGTKKEIAAIENLKKGKEGRRLHNIAQQEKAWDVIAEAMQQADIHNDMEYLMANEHSTGWRKGYKKGMLKYRDTLNKLQTNPYGIEYVAKKLGEKPEWVLDMVEESKDFAQGERTPIKDTRIKSDFAKAERWLVNNGSRYADPDKFKKAFIKRFGKNNAFISGAGRKPDFSLKFVAEFLSDKPGKLSTGTIDNIFKTAIYNLNPTVRDKIVKTLTDFESMKPMRSRGAVRDWMNSQKILVKFGINEKINGPISRLIQKSIGDEAYKNIQTLRRPYNNTVNMLDYYASKASPKYKKMFTETAEALRSASGGDWKLSASQLKKADKIMYDHKVPSSFIDAGYADEINRAKVVPTSKNFNMEIKMREFDSPMMRLFNKYKKAAPFEKKGIYQDILKKKEDFSRKYGRYLDDVSIDVDKKGKLKMSSTAEVVTKKTDLPKLLKTSLAQEKGMAIKLLKDSGYRCLKSSGGKEDVACYLRDARNQLKSVKNREPGIGRKLARFRNFGKKAILLGFGPADVVLEGLFAQHGIASGRGKDQIWADSILGMVIPQSLGGPKWSDEIRLEKISELGGKEYVDALKQEQEFNNILDQYNDVGKIPDKVRGYDASNYKQKLYNDLDKVADEYITRQEYLPVPKDARPTELDEKGEPLWPRNLGPQDQVMKWSQDLNPDSFAAQDFRTANEKLQAMEAAKGQASGVPPVKLETQEAERIRKTGDIGEHPRGEDYWVEFFRDLRGWDPAWSGPYGTGYSFKHEGTGDYYKEGGRVSYLNGGIASLKKK